MGGAPTLPTATTPGYTTLTVKYGPDVACTCDATWWPAFVRFLQSKGKTPPVVWQAVGANALSGNTHAGGGALDWSGIDRETVMYAREAGRPDTWPRDWENNRHTHSIANGCPHLSDAARQQLGEVRERDDGLAADGPDPLPAPRTYRTWQQGVAWMEQEMDDMFSDSDRALLKYVSAQAKALGVLIEAVPAEVWNTPVIRDGVGVPVIQEVADAKTQSIATVGQILALAAGLGPKVEAAVKAALTEAVVDVNVNFPAPAPAPEVTP